VFVAALFGTALDSMVVEPVARALMNEWLDKWIKVLSVLLLLLGFHFDLLAS
jgi:hypothetical protein